MRAVVTAKSKRATGEGTDGVDGESNEDGIRRMTHRLHKVLLAGVVLACTGLASAAPPAVSPNAPAATPDFTREVAPILTKFCAGCHNADDFEGELSVTDHAALLQGGEAGKSIVPGDADASLLIKVLTGKSKPKMPPKGKAGPSEAQVETLKAWINAGAKGSAGGAVTLTPPKTPFVEPLKVMRPADGAITALADSPDGAYRAFGRFGRVNWGLPSPADEATHAYEAAGKVNALSFSRDSKQLIVATGIAGVGGEAVILDTATGKVVRKFTGHGDVLYDAELSPDGKVLATASYDKRIILWDSASGKQLRTIAGHNGAVFDLAFSPDGAVLASASADETVKLWRVRDGLRLDTLHQPTAEQYTVAFSPDGRYVVAGGADNRIRVWRFVSRDRQRINPLVHTRFAHEGAILKLVFAQQGRALVSLADNQSIKLWHTGGYTLRHVYPRLADAAPTLAVSAKQDTFVVGGGGGSGLPQPFKIDLSGTETGARLTLRDWAHPAKTDRAPADVVEREPNDRPAQAMTVAIPATITGVVESGGASGASGDSGGGDLFRFDAKAGEQWVIEVNAARSKSPLDSKIEVLHADGEPVTRVLLQAVRDSYFTFRGKDSSTSDDFRVHNWREMELNEFLYAGGEVVKLWHYPRGPDSGFMVYPGAGKRWSYFDTTPLAHALHAPCYIVRPHDPGTELTPNGLPVFKLNYVNDDESRRRLGSDSKLTFAAPRDGSYLVRITDSRGFGGDAYKYALTIRPRAPRAKVTLHGANAKVNRGGGREFHVTVERVDDYEGPVRVEITGAPPGFEITSPLVIEAGQTTARGTIHARADAPKLTKQNASATKVVAMTWRGRTVLYHDVNNLGTITLVEKVGPRVTILPGDRAHLSSSARDGKPMVLMIRPGQTFRARVKVDRAGVKGPISFGKADAGRNLPHGVYIDNIGLNGLLIVPDKSEREFFITAAKWVRPGERLFHLRANVDGGHVSWPVVLQVLPSAATGGGE